jgi:hypothetical protein
MTHRTRTLTSATVDAMLAVLFALVLAGFINAILTPRAAAAECWPADAIVAEYRAEAAGLSLPELKELPQGEFLAFRAMAIKQGVEGAPEATHGFLAWDHIFGAWVLGLVDTNGCLMSPIILPGGMDAIPTAAGGIS